MTSKYFYSLDDLFYLKNGLTEVNLLPVF